MNDRAEAAEARTAERLDGEDRPVVTDAESAASAPEATAKAAPADLPKPGKDKPTSASSDGEGARDAGGDKAPQMDEASAADDKESGDDEAERRARRAARAERREARQTRLLERKAQEADAPADRSDPPAAEARSADAETDAAADAEMKARREARRERRVLRSSRDAFPEDDGGATAAVGGTGAGAAASEAVAGSRALAPYENRGRRRAVAKVDERGRAPAAKARDGGRRKNAVTPAEIAPPTLTARQKRELALPTRAAEADRPRIFGRLLRWTFALFVLAPSIFVGLFYLFIAAPQYVAESQFAVRGASLVEQSEVPSILAGAGPPSMPEIADSLILVDYVHSREVVDSLIQNANFLEIYSRPEADFYYRLDPTLPIEEIVDYWRMMTYVHFDETSLIMSLEVRAFRAEDAERIAEHVIELSEELVNELSVRARTDSVRLAQEEVALAEARFRNARTALAEFRDQEREFDPIATATSRQQILATLQAQLTDNQALLASLRSTMSDDAPRVVYVENQIEAIRRQIAAERENVAMPEALGGANEPILTRRLARFEELEAEREFAQVAYTSTLAALETARVDAAKQQRYLSVFVRPELPEEPLFPQGFRWTAIVAAGLLFGWGIFALIAAAFRDHLA